MPDALFPPSVLGKGEHIAGHMVLGRARDSVPELRRAVVAARDQGLAVEELHLRDGTAAHARKHISINTSPSGLKDFKGTASQHYLFDAQRS